MVRAASKIFGLINIVVRNELALHLAQSQRKEKSMRAYKLFVVVLVVAAILGTATFAGATCTIGGKIMFMNRSSGGVTYVYVAPLTSLPTYYYVYTTVDANFIAMLTAAQAANNRIYVTGSVTTCPTAGTTRGAGVISNVQTFSN